MRQSSANSLVCDGSTRRGRSLIYTRNNIDPSTVPCGIPEVTGLVFDDFPSSFIPVIEKWSDPSQKYSHQCRFLGSFSKRRGRAIISKAFASVWVPLWSHCVMKSYEVIVWQQQLRLALTFLSETKLCIGQDLVLAGLMIWELITFHNFEANWCQRHWSVICTRSVVTLLEDWDYVCCSPFYRDPWTACRMLRISEQTDLLLPSRVELVPRQFQ